MDIPVYYDHLIEVLKKPFHYTYNYFIYLNVLPEHRAAFKAYVAWHYVYATTFSKDIRNGSKLQKDETFKVILEQCKLELADNFRDWNSIRNKYFDFIKEYVAVVGSAIIILIGFKVYQGYLSSIFFDSNNVFGLNIIWEMFLSTVVLATTIGASQKIARMFLGR